MNKLTNRSINFRSAGQQVLSEPRAAIPERTRSHDVISRLIDAVIGQPVSVERVILGNRLILLNTQ